MSSSVTTSSNKRRKTSSSLGGHIQTLTDLPNDQLTAIADFLPKTWRALFAVALTAPSASWRATGWRGEPSDASKAIISSTKPSLLYSVPPQNEGHHAKREREAKKDYYEAHWDVLDFVNIEKDFTNKLTDVDVGAILVCIDAKNKLRRLRLTNCLWFVGHGLDPLRGSVALEQFDASKSSLSLLSKEAIIPILDSIIDADGNSLRRLDLPEEWNKGKARNEPPLSEFFAKFNELMLNEELKCVHCDQLCGGDGNNLSCQVCFKNRNCAGCVESGDIPMWDDDYLFVRSCDHCDLMLCSSCGSHEVCRGCDSAFCELCAGIDDIDAAIWCDANYCYREKFCLGCRMPGGPAADADCHACMSLVHVGKNKELRNENESVVEENNQLRDENERMNEENKQLRQEVEELRKKLSPALGILA